MLSTSLSLGYTGMPVAQASRSSAVSMSVSKPMNAMPFLTAAACQSSGLTDAATGFDPLYFSDFLDIKFLREAELKHGRICMLASTGYMAQEVVSNKGKFSMSNMFEDGRAPGDLGFDPLKFKDNKETNARLEMAELKNGLLAMLTFSGMIHQTFVTGK